MDRVNVYAESDGYEAGALLGWFDLGKATRWSNRVHDRNTGQAVILTAQGKWVLEHWSDWAGQESSYVYITASDARDWLIREHEDDAVKAHFGPVAEEEDRRPGRPAIGEPVNVRLGELLGRVDAFAVASGRSRADAIRELVLAGLIKLEGH